MATRKADQQDETPEVVDETAPEAPEVVESPTEIAEPERTYPTQNTVVGTDGVPRLVPSVDPGWEPAPVDPDEADVERAKARNEAEDAAAARAEKAAAALAEGDKKDES